MIRLFVSIIIIFLSTACDARSPELQLERKIVKLQKNTKNLEAIETFNARSTSIAPTGVTYRNVALCYFGLNRSAESLAHSKKALEIDPSDETAANLIFANAKKLRQFEENEGYATEWMARPDAKETLRHISIFYAQWGRHEQAFEATTIGMARSPKDARMAGMHAYLLAILEGATAQKEFVDEWVSRHKPISYFWENVGKGLSDIKEYETSLPYFLKAMKQNSSADVASQYLSSLRGAKRPQDASDWAKQWLKKHKPDSGFLKMQGAVNYDVGNYEEAIEALEAALDSDPSSAQAFVSLIVTLQQLKRYEEAIRLGNDWINQNRSQADNRCYFYLGDAYAWNHQYEESIEMYAIAIEMAPDKQRYVGNLFFSMNQLEQFKEIVDYYNHWRIENPEYSDLHFEKQLSIAIDRANGQKAPALEN